MPVQRHVRVALKLKEKHQGSLDLLNLYSAGSYIPYIITDESDKEGVIHADDFTGQYDMNYYYNACYDPSKRILEAVYPQVNWDEV